MHKLEPEHSDSGVESVLAPPRFGSAQRPMPISGPIWLAPDPTFPRAQCTIRWKWGGVVMGAYAYLDRTLLDKGTQSLACLRPPCTVCVM